jgi:hypothetical protein
VPNTTSNETSRRGCRKAVLISLVSVTLSACVTYAAPSQHAIADSVAPVRLIGLRFTTTDGTAHALTRIRVARDTLFGIPAGIGGPELGFALPDIQRFDVIQPTPPRPYITRGADAL